MIIPGILTDRLDEAQQQLDTLARLKPRPTAVQIDIIDGLFTNNLTFEPGAISELNTHGLPLDVHLMAVEPAQLIAELSGVSLRTVIAQVERLPEQEEFYRLVREQGWQAGLSLNLYTPLSAIDAVSWPELAVVQIMGGEAGHQGEFFHPSTRRILSEAKQYRDHHHLSCRIMIDIGMNPDTVPLAQTAGADDCVVGSYLLTQTAAHWQQLQKAAHE